MSTPLLQQFPSLSSYPPSFLKDLLSSPALTEAFLFTLPEVHELAAEVERLGRENEGLAREFHLLDCFLHTRLALLIPSFHTRAHRRCSGQNLDLREQLLNLRDITAQSYAHAEHLKLRWTEIEKAQANLYQVSFHRVESCKPALGPVLPGGSPDPY